MNEQEPEKALALVELFSDKVLETVYEKLEYLEFRTVESCLVFKMGKTDQSLISIQRKPGSSLDLSTPEGIHNALRDHFPELELFTSKRNYTQEREMEIHVLITQGCVLSSAEFWNALEEIVTTEN